MGADFDHRWTQAREYVLAMKALWTQDEAEFHGRYVDFPAVRCNPKPAQKPHPPVLLGGAAKNVFKREAVNKTIDDSTKAIIKFFEEQS